MWALLVLCSMIASHGVQGSTTPDLTADTSYDALTGAPCGGYLYNSRGSFFSPNYPGSYPHHADCVWYIRPGSQVIELEFTEMDLENHFSCGYDAIYVYDGSSTGTPLLGRICGNWSATFHSTGSYLTVRFTSDGIVSHRGFRAEYRVVANPCGGSMYGSGSFSSPYYPSYYHDNSYCVWYLRTRSDERISLSITDLQFENCCYCDYIAIYDGPSLGSRFLGKVCENSTNDFFHSSSNYMTVLFRTDGSVVGRGFSAKFTSSLPPSSGRVDCSSDNMNIVISRSYLTSMGYGGHDLYLNDQYCRPQITSYQVIFSFPVNTCGTIRRFENGRVLYTNAIRAHKSQYGEITRQSHFKLHVDCRMEQDTTAQIMYIARDTNSSDVTGSGRFNATMAFYTSSSFYYKKIRAQMSTFCITTIRQRLTFLVLCFLFYQVTEVPYKVSLNQDMFVEMRLRRDDSSLVLFVDTCVASPNPHDFHTRSYDLVRDGCKRDSTYYAYSSGSSYVARFTFKSFQFLRTHDSVYLQCKILICPASDYNSRCRRGCYKRKARDLGSEHESQSLVLGPIQLKDFEKQDGGDPKDEETPKEENKAE
ncbi:deleted in malignant brain tumors 1 protein-like [Myripristis murdjan]|uniref:deleted in malignant brain tumors 1 protein-like n=1 Tax=Myripristis murdjan TaxID=586833 RepID=UPI0011762D43|nr:deleted in malignant brain tumors 1 protein-like [Myripristis murdjan]